LEIDKQAISSQNFAFCKKPFLPYQILLEASMPLFASLIVSTFAWMQSMTAADLSPKAAYHSCQQSQPGLPESRRCLKIAFRAKLRQRLFYWRSNVEN
jgi:hypothetical protein